MVSPGINILGSHNEIKSKLRDFQSTEGVLPQVEEDEIESKKAAEIKYSPLPTWLETLIVEYTKIHKGNVSKNLKTLQTKKTISILVKKKDLALTYTQSKEA